MTTLFHPGRTFGAMVATLLFLGLHTRAQFIATGTDDGTAAHVKAFRGTDLNETQSFFPYPGFSGGVRVAVGDVNGDVKPDIVTAPGSGVASQVKVFDGGSGAELKSFLAFDPTFTGGVFVGAGDINHDGFDDVVAGTGDGSVAHVKVFSGSDFSTIRSFFPYGVNYTGGVRVAAGDVDGDGFADIITGTATGTTHVKIFSGQTQAEIGSFFAYGPSFQGGVFVAAGDLDGDGRAEILTGIGPGAGPHVKVFNASNSTEITSFFAYDAGFTGGVRVAVGDVNGDGRAEIITAPGSGSGPQIKAFDVKTNAEVRSFLAYSPSFSGGVFVGSRAPRGSIRFSVATTAPTNVSFTTATLNGTVNANGGTATVSFQYGAGANLDSIIAAKPSEVSGRTITAVSADLTGLTPGKTYSARLLALDGVGDPVYGEPVTFTARVNIPPSGGTFAVLPLSPVTTGTVLTASFDGWIDQDGHTPLTYEVREGTEVVVPAQTGATATFVLPGGTHQLYGRVYDTLGAFTDTAAVGVVVVSEPLSDLLYAAGDPVPGAGAGGIPEDARWTNFGVPAIDELGQVAFVAKWGSTKGSGGGIYRTGSGFLVLSGQLVPGAGTGGDLAIPEGAVFKSFKDPVVDTGGIAVFIATVSGKGVSAANDTVVVSNARTGALEVIAREGSPAPGANGAKFKFFNGISARISQGDVALAPGQFGGTIFTARLAGVRANEDFGAWWVPPGGNSRPILWVREGSAGFEPDETIKSFILHQSLPGSPGHGRGQIDADEALIQVTLSSGKQAIVLGTPDTLTELTEAGDTFDEDNSVWIRMSQPSSGNGDQYLSVLGTFGPAAAAGTARPGVGVLRSLDGGSTWTVVAAAGQSVGGHDSIWIDFGSPVTRSTGAALAFRAKTKSGTQGSSDGIWWLPEGGSLQRVASTGVQAAGCATGEKWSAFKSLALPGGAGKPLFVAVITTLDGRINRRQNDMGVWTVDSSGATRLLFREGGTNIGGKTVKTFNVLKEVSGSPGVTRAFNTRGQLVWQATFADGTTGVVVTQLP